MIFKLAWRNIWRNKWRSGITVASIAFAVFFAVAMRSLQLGTYDRLIESVVNTYTGYVQIHQKGYWDDQILDNAMEIESLTEISDQLESEGIEANYRIQSFALAATESKTKGALVLGLELEDENRMMNFDDMVQSGTWQIEGRDHVLMSEGLAEFFKSEVGDTLILMGQGYHGMTAAGKYAVAGILKFPSPQMNNNLVMLPYQSGSEFFSAPGLATEVVLNVESARDVNEAKELALAGLDTAAFEVMDWQEMMPEMVQTMQADSAGGLVMVLILYMVISFGILGTVIMMTNERKYEFGVLVAVGMKRFKLMAILMIETVILAVSGVLLGWAMGYPVMSHFHRNPIILEGQMAEALEGYGWEPMMMASTDPSILITHGIIVLVIAVVVGFLPIASVLKLKPVEAMRGI
jgi:ABC-type lipoprotein release transport system permease subunit